jgi:RNA polymerase sigma-70 factor (sigma-E family)
MDVTDAEERADWAEVATALAPTLLRLAVMLTGSSPDAEDLLQATFARAQRHGERIVTMAAPTAYLRRIMLNEHVSGRRRRRVHTVPLVDGAVEATAPASESGHDLWPWLATLPRQQRAVLVLRYYEDLPDDEIATLVGCSPATVRSHASHGLAKLRAVLTEEFR